MGATTFYALPYPDPDTDVDVARDIKALADKLELWKNGFTVPTGNVVVGNTATDGATAYLAIQRRSSADRWEWNFFPHNPSGFGIAQLKQNDVEISRFIQGIDGSFQTVHAGRQRPFPYAMWCARTTVVVSSAVSGNSPAISLPAGRFTAPAGASSYHAFVTTASTLYYGYITTGDNSSITVGCRHVDNVVGSASLSVNVMVVQMTPTTGPG